MIDLLLATSELRSNSSRWPERHKGSGQTRPAGLKGIKAVVKGVQQLLQHLDSSGLVEFRVGTTGTKGAGILYAPDKCPTMNQHPLWFLIGH